MTFASPELLYCLLGLPALIGLRFWASFRAASVVRNMTAPRLRSQLVVGVSAWRSALIFSLQLMALACFIIALAQPRWGEDKVTQLESGRNVIIAMDTSRSMLANDLLPNRLTRAKLAAQDILGTLKTDRVGLIAFAGNAYLQAPLTTDHEAIVEAIQSLDFTSVPRGGTELGRALKLAMETFEKNPAKNHGLILFSDGGEPDVDLKKSIEQAVKMKVLVLTVGVGTEDGALIPDPDPDRSGEFVRSPDGNVVKTRLEGAVLQQIATATGGRYLKLGSQPLAVSVVRELMAALQAQTNDAKEQVKPIERFQWPLSIGVLFLMIAWFLRPSPAVRRVAPAVALICLVLGTTSAQAEKSPASWWPLTNKAEVTREEAEKAQKEGNHKKAVDLFAKLLKEKPPETLRYRYAQALGYSAHHLTEYDRAVGAFSEALESHEESVVKLAHQGLGHSLYDQGDRVLAKMPRFTVKTWTDALKHLNAVLKLDPENKDVKENRDFIQKRLDALKEQIRQQEEKDGQKGKKGDKKKGKKGDGDEEGEGEEGDEDADGKGKGDKDRSRKESVGKQKGDKKEEAIPEGELEANENPEGKQQDGAEEKDGQEGENSVNEETGFTPNEARAYLRSYADDHKRALLLRPRDPPRNGKDW